VRWRLTGWIAAIGALASTLALALYGTDEPGLRVAIRVTARLGAIVFTAAFAASALNALYRRRWTKWLLRERRYIGVGFACVHFMHAALISALAILHTESFFATTAMTSIIVGSVGYAWLAAMVATSTDRTAAALGRRAWKVLHVSGMWGLWGIFVFSYAGRALTNPIYGALLSILLLALVARIAAAVATRRG
jgi:hypothetical protein